MSTPQHQTDDQRRAIVDIGSNSIRLVVFGGPPRAPAQLFNEKLMAGLGRAVVSGGKLDPEAVRAALSGLARFAALITLMGIEQVRVVATAAVRDAADGREFLGKVRALGLPAELLNGEGEALAAAHGVLGALPEAEGLVADMGGGSLELARISGGEVHERVSLPFGAMRVASIRAGGRGRLRKAVRKAFGELDWLVPGEAHTLYLVGGSWRAVARVHMHLAEWPLPVLGGYAFPAADTRELKATIRAMGSATLATIPGVSNQRVLQLDDASAMLAALAAESGASRVVISPWGLREGLLYEDLSPELRAADPLIEAVRDAVRGQMQAEGSAEALLAWSDGAFPDEAPALRRLRTAVCLIAGTGWASNPDFRTLAGEDMALHGNWAGASHADRALMASALHTGLGGDPVRAPALLERLAPADDLRLAQQWGLALRLAQRLGITGGAALAALPLALADDGALTLSLPSALADNGTQRRLARLASALGRTARVIHLN